MGWKGVLAIALVGIEFFIPVDLIRVDVGLLIIEVKCVVNDRRTCLLWRKCAGSPVVLYREPITATE